MNQHEEREPEYVSKSRRKREMIALQKLGQQLLELSADELASLPLPATLVEAIGTARRLEHARSARRRQIQYIGRLMREIDPEPLRRALDRIGLRDRHATERFHRLERARERLLGEGEDALAAVLAEFPAADRRRLRALARDARAGQRGAARALFRYLRDCQQKQGGTD
jgi:ribosome-associated protein